jgi:hypothetical protein
VVKDVASETRRTVDGESSGLGQETAVQQATVGCAFGAPSLHLTLYSVACSRVYSETTPLAHTANGTCGLGRPVPLACLDRPPAFISN